MTDIFAIQTDVAHRLGAAGRVVPEEKPGSGAGLLTTSAAPTLSPGRYCYTRYTEDWIRKGIEYRGRSRRTPIRPRPPARPRLAELAAGQGGGSVTGSRTRAMASLQGLALIPGGRSLLGAALLRFSHSFDWPEPTGVRWR
jgi:hypothetical protein